MEHESFEDEEVADIMNAHFICVKVDREERPDVDQLYMNAAQTYNWWRGMAIELFRLPGRETLLCRDLLSKRQMASIARND